MKFAVILICVDNNQKHVHYHVVRFDEGIIYREKVQSIPDANAAHDSTNSTKTSNVTRTAQ